jgi:hypothetical protein
MDETQQLLVRFGSAAKRYIEAVQQGNLFNQEKLKRDLILCMNEMTPEDANTLARHVASRREAVDRLTSFANGTSLAVQRQDVREVLELARLAVSVANDVTEHLERLGKV